ncbi:MAG TPA: Fe-S cluster assembly protein SufD [Methylocella sp.]|nr:Fe-S cluster assembly protein SufD [Methylocella sp.]
MSEITSLNRLLDRMAGFERGGVPWLDALREEARTLFAGSGLPTRRVEAWKYSDLARALAKAAEGSGPARPAPEIPGAHVALFENGILNEGQSTLAAIGAIPLRQVLADPATPFAKRIGHVNPQKNHALLNLNTALMEDGLVLHVPAGVSLPAPLHLRYDWAGKEAADPDGRHLRIVLLLEEGAEATVVEAHSGSPGFATLVNEVHLAPKAKLTHLRFERLGAAARQSAVTLGELFAASSYKGFYFSEGGLFSRHEALLELRDQEAHAEIDGIYLVGDGRHCDNTTILAHAGVNTSSQQSFRGVLAGDSRGVYQGCVRVLTDAQETDARQMSRTLLLSDRAEMATKPELEILADNVKCSHGSTAGELDTAALFFLRTRGIPEADARALLIEAFLGEGIATIASEPLQNLAAGLVSDWLAFHASEIAHAE